MAGKKVSKAAAYRDAEAELGRDVTLDNVHKFILDKYGINMPKGQISAYRSLEKKARGAKFGRKNAVASEKPKNAGGDPLIEFVSQVRGWENKLGADKICEVIAALYEKK
jgi:hypothetical protein